MIRKQATSAENLLLAQESPPIVSRPGWYIFRRTACFTTFASASC